MTTRASMIFTGVPSLLAADQTAEARPWWCGTDSAAAFFDHSQQLLRGVSRSLAVEQYICADPGRLTAVPRGVLRRHLRRWNHLVLQVLSERQRHLAGGIELRLDYGLDLRDGWNTPLDLEDFDRRRVCHQEVNQLGRFLRVFAAGRNRPVHRRLVDHPW